MVSPPVPKGGPSCPHPHGLWCPLGVPFLSPRVFPPVPKAGVCPHRCPCCPHPHGIWCPLGVPSCPHPCGTCCPLGCPSPHPGLLIPPMSPRCPPDVPRVPPGAVGLSVEQQQRWAQRIARHVAAASRTLTRLFLVHSLPESLKVTRWGHWGTLREWGHWGGLHGDIGWGRGDTLRGTIGGGLGTALGTLWGQ